MAEIKDKVVTVESLKALFDDFDGDIRELYDELDKFFLRPENNVVPIANGGTSASDGATGLKNLFASGNTVLSSYQYGDILPTAGTKGRIFFKRLTE